MDYPLVIDADYRDVNGQVWLDQIDLMHVGVDYLIAKAQGSVLGELNPTTVIEYAIPEAVHVRVRVFDVLGRVVRTSVDEPQQTGRYRVSWDATNSSGRRVASGVYFYRVEAGPRVESRKMVLVQ